jgi:hypothetical protein
MWAARAPIFDYESDEDLLMLMEFSFHANAAMSDDLVPYWKMPFKPIRNIPAKADVPWVEREYLRRHPKWMKAEFLRRYFLRILSRLELLSEAHGLDPRPLFWFRRFLQGTHDSDRLSASEQRDLRDFLELLGGKLPQQSRTPADRFEPNDRQKAMLLALKDRALTKQALADEVCGGEGSRLYRRGWIKELRDVGLVDHKHGLGYFRPDCPPRSA